MKVCLLLAGLLCGLAAPCWAANAATLKVTLQGVDDSGGQVRVVVYSKDNFLTHDALYTRHETAVAGDMVLAFGDLPAGQWAVLAYHDTHMHDDLDRNFLGIPTVQFGFSNNPGYTHRPDFQECAFSTTADKDTAIDLKLSD